MPVVPSADSSSGGAWRDISGIYNSPEQKFHDLRDRWKESCGVTATVAEMAMHPAYQQIIGMGSAALPFLFRELQNDPDHWFWALRSITGLDPVPPSDQGELAKMTADWISWGLEHAIF